jgi:large subunit ribosomal protein L1
MELKEKIKKALEELRKNNQKRKFEQTVDLIINLQKFDVKRTPINMFVNVPHKIKDKKVCAFLEVKDKNVDTITKSEFKKYEDKKEIKKLIRNYDFFIAQANLMPSVATTFGRVLGPTGKMPSPQLGILSNPDEKTISETVDKINSSVKIRLKEPSLKVSIGKESMKDEEITENVIVVYNAFLKNMPRNLENIKNIEIKFTMTKPQRISIRD